MTEDQVERVRKSFSAVMPHMDAFSASFYDQLFLIDPSTRALFINDLVEQRRKLMLTLSTVIHELSDLSRLLPSIRDLAVRHVGYGVCENHYQLVGTALISALRQHVTSFDAEDENAWAAAYSLLSGAMIEAVHRKH